MRIVNLGALVAGWALAAASPTLLADEIYKSVGKDGAVTYSQAPLPGAKNTVIDVQALSPEERRAALMLRRQLASADSVLDSSFAKREEAWHLADVEIRDASEKLMLEESTLDSGREPRAEEWIHNVGGGSRLTEDYFERLKHLEANVAMARARLDRAYEARNALR